MSLPRVLEVEYMDTAAEAAAYDAMDHRQVNRVFVDDLIAATNAGAEVAANTADTADGIAVTGDAGVATGSAGADNGVSSGDGETLDVLDLGAGTARIPIELCQRLVEARVLAVDAAAHMLELAHYNVEIAGLSERVQLMQADAKRLPFRDGMFHVVISNSILHHIPEPLLALREAVRVTAPGGLLFFRDLLRPDTAEQLQRLVSQYAGGEADTARQMFADSLNAALSLAEIQAAVATLGFASNTVRATSDRHWTWVARR
ncbi:MAG: class I SAM-dependent methyltransferase [Planctomycetota bacterium]